MGVKIYLKKWLSWQMTYSINKMRLHTQDTFKKVGPGEEVGGVEA